jgi:hypothetical protein
MSSMRTGVSHVSWGSHAHNNNVIHVRRDYSCKFATRHQCHHHKSTRKRTLLTTHKSSACWDIETGACTRVLPGAHPSETQWDLSFNTDDYDNIINKKLQAHVHYRCKDGRSRCPQVAWQFQTPICFPTVKQGSILPAGLVMRIHFRIRIAFAN